MTDTIGLARLRQGLYRYFGGALLPPDEQRVAVLRAATQFLDGAGIEEFAFYGAWKRFAERTTVARAPRLSVEYVRLFASGVDGALCPPIESFYRAEAKGGGVARAVSKVEQAYGAIGLGTSSGFEPPDHASVELDAMSALCEREAREREAEDLEGMAKTLRAEDWFLRRHLAVWFPEFRARVANVRYGDPFYTSLVDAAHAFIVHESDLMRLLTREIVGAPS